MRQPPSAPEIARKIVGINAELMKHHTPERRDALVTLQRTMWNSTFPGCSFDQIEATIH